MISPEEGYRAYDRDDFYATAPMLPEIGHEEKLVPRGRAYGSNDDVMNYEETLALLKEHKLLIGDVREDSEEELLS
jgi:hypothetical protein